MDNSTVGAAPRLFWRIFSEVTYIRTVGNSTVLKIYTVPNHTVTIGVCILETQLLGLLYGGGASFGQKWPCRGCLLIYRSLFYIIWFLCLSSCWINMPLFIYFFGRKRALFFLHHNKICILIDRSGNVRIRIPKTVLGSLDKKDKKMPFFA
jgi:hypothetical protein